MAVPRKKLVQRLSEPQSAVGGRQFRADRHAGSLDINQQFAPALGAVANANLKTDQFLTAFRRGADQDENAFGHRLPPGMKVRPVGLEVE